MSVIRYSISTHGNSVAEHFGRCPSYTLIDVDDGKIVERREVPNPGHSTGSIPTYMKELNVDVMVSGGMGRRAIAYFQEFGIKTVLGITGPLDQVISRIENNSLEGSNSLCSPGGGKNYGIPKADGHH